MNKVIIKSAEDWESFKSQYSDMRHHYTGARWYDSPADFESPSEYPCIVVFRIKQEDGRTTIEYILAYPSEMEDE